MTWIPCSERLPGDLVDVLVYAPTICAGAITGCHYATGSDNDASDEWRVYCWDLPERRLVGADHGLVTHWMPLPDPPKEDA